MRKRPVREDPFENPTTKEQAAESMDEEARQYVVREISRLVAMRYQGPEDQVQSKGVDGLICAAILDVFDLIDARPSKKFDVQFQSEVATRVTSWIQKIPRF